MKNRERHLKNIFNAKEDSRKQKCIHRSEIGWHNILKMLISPLWVHRGGMDGGAAPGGAHASSRVGEADGGDAARVRLATEPASAPNQ